MKKYKLTDETTDVLGITLHRVKALKDFDDVKKGELGGYVESERNLSQAGNCWVYDNAKVCDNAWVYGNAKVYGNAWVCGDAMICSDTDYMSIKGLGSEYRSTTIFRTKGKNIAVRCGCFYGTLTEFVDRVKEAHGNSKYAKEYLALVDLVKIHFESEE